MQYCENRIELNLLIIIEMQYFSLFMFSILDLTVD
jgi:hypothetical protein